ncbi:hypothetical protein Plhal304r1_c042g0120971 [Plasmopara halstedii]
MSGIVCLVSVGCKYIFSQMTTKPCRSLQFGTFYKCSKNEISNDFGWKLTLSISILTLTSLAHLYEGYRSSFELEISRYQLATGMRVSLAIKHFLWDRGRLFVK